MTLEDRTAADAAYWAQVEREAPLRAIAKSEDAAKQLIGLTTLLSTLYFGIASFNDVLKQSVSGQLALTFALPLPFWLASLTLATRVIVPRAHLVVDIQSDYQEISRRKHRTLRWSYTVLIASMVVLLSNVIAYLLWVPAPPP